MMRWHRATVIGLLAVALIAPPMAAFFRTEPVRQWTAIKWVVVLMPNVFLALLIYGLALGVYLGMLLLRISRPDPPVAVPDQAVASAPGLGGISTRRRFLRSPAGALEILGHGSGAGSVSSVQRVEGQARSRSGDGPRFQ